jgi:DNA-binding HxlR family transcriptional regulator
MGTRLPTVKNKAQYRILRRLMLDPLTAYQIAKEKPPIDDKTVYHHLENLIADGWVKKNDGGEYELLDNKLIKSFTETISKHSIHWMEPKQEVTDYLKKINMNLIVSSLRAFCYHTGGYYTLEDAYLVFLEFSGRKAQQYSNFKEEELTIKLSEVQYELLELGRMTKHLGLPNIYNYYVYHRIFENKPVDDTD